MSYAAERAVIRQRFAAAWNNRTPIAWPNVDFRIPATAWVRFGFFPGPADQISVGGGGQDLYRADGDVVIEIFAPRGKGDPEAAELTDLAVEAFRGFRTASIAFWTPRATAGEEVDGWWKVDVIAPYQRDSRHARAS